MIRISCDNIELIFQVSPKKRLYQSYFGPKLLDENDISQFSWDVHAGSDIPLSNRGWEVYPGSGYEDFFEPALAITHPDGNQCSILYFISCHQKYNPNDTQMTTIVLRDDQYPVDVILHYIAYLKLDVIQVWSEIRHNETKPILLTRYASTILYFAASSYYLTEFASDWARECQMQMQELKFGKKVIDSTLGSRAAMFCHPFFELGIDQPPAENQGIVLLGNLGWTGNFSMTFEVDNTGNLRLIPAINSMNSTYELEPNTVFKTPEFTFTLSTSGTGKASRNLHDFLRNYQLFDGKGQRLTLLNNWENTYFNFDEELLGKLMKDAKQLGVDLFLLDDGWFGNKYPRNDDTAGLGDWQANRTKLPGGIPKLIEFSKEAGVKFGIWIEPEMVNPKSELFENHPDWAIRLPNRETYYYRNQLVLDLSNPEVQNFVFGVLDSILTENPEVSFFKWDCNSPITNAYSPFLGKKQGNMYIDHVRGVYNVFQRVRAKYPQTPIMMCSGGGSRCDYEALKYFSEFWCSDNTDPIDRCFIQYGFSHVFPAKAMCAHVTSWNKSASLKFRTDVASMCKLGFDLGLKDLSKDDITFAQTAVNNWKRLQTVILDGDQYRLFSPYGFSAFSAYSGSCGLNDSNDNGNGTHMAVEYVSVEKNKAVVFVYDLMPRYQSKLLGLKLQGLEPLRKYKIEEINLMPGKPSTLPENGKVLSGDFLMKVGLNAFTAQRLNSKVIELTSN